MLDHIVLATPDVQATVDEIAAATGVRAGVGGRFTQMGAYNHLLALQDGAYLEIIGPDPENEGGGSMPFGIDRESGRAHISPTGAGRATNALTNSPPRPSRQVTTWARSSRSDATCPMAAGSTGD